jgi:hypothetical protein
MPAWETTMPLCFEPEFFTGPAEPVGHPLHRRDGLSPRPAASRDVERRIRAQEEAWAMHADAACGFGAGETASPAST